MRTTSSNLVFIFTLCASQARVLFKKFATCARVSSSKTLLHSKAHPQHATNDMLDKAVMILLSTEIMRRAAHASAIKSNVGSMSGFDISHTIRFHSRPNNPADKRGNIHAEVSPVAIAVEAATPIKP